MSRASFADQSDRERLSPAALRTFVNIMARWQVDDQAARELIGVSPDTFAAVKASPDQVLDAEALLRVSYLIGIFKSLSVLYSGDLAAGWVRLPNDNPMFAGQAPLAFMTGGGSSAIAAVRRLLDARASGG